MVERYPPIEPYASAMLDVGGGQHLYWEASGNPDGVAALHLHGGPGAGSSAGSRRLFDPDAYRIVQFDQRGCGRSRPLASDLAATGDLGQNTTAHLVADIEALREHLGIDSWVVVGGSWGVTLALVYAQAHPQRVRALVLGAVTAGTRAEIEWITRDVGRIFPREWQAFLAPVPADQRGGDLASAYARLLADQAEAVREAAARAWCTWEDVHVSLTPGWAPSPRYAESGFRMVFARLVTHYWSHGCFLADGHVLTGMHHLAAIPGVLVHGRLDVSGPAHTAWALHQAWPGSELVLLDDAGHGGTTMTTAMVAALDGLRQPAAG